MTAHESKQKIVPISMALNYSFRIKIEYFWVRICSRKENNLKVHPKLYLRVFNFHIGKVRQMVKLLLLLR